MLNQNRGIYYQFHTWCEAFYFLWEILHNISLEKIEIILCIEYFLYIMPQIKMECVYAHV